MPRKSFCKPIGWESMKYIIVIGLVIAFGSVNGFAQRKVPKLKPLAVQDTSVMDSCTRLGMWLGANPSTQEYFQIQYDSLRAYIEHCAMVDGAYEAFNVMTGDVANIDLQDTTRYDVFRSWLLSVLYLNPNPIYFCSCVEAISHTYDAGEYHHVPNAALAVLKFLIDDSNCVSPGLIAVYDNSLVSIHDSWLEGDTSKPQDTTLPPLDSIGLGILLQHPAGVLPATELPQTYLTSVTTSPNPFKQETELQFTLSRMAYITVEVYDLLGRKVWGDDHGYSLDAGLHTVQIDGTYFPSGTLYARISTGFGEVQTVKLVHEQ